MNRPTFHHGVAVTVERATLGPRAAPGIKAHGRSGPHRAEEARHPAALARCGAGHTTRPAAQRRRHLMRSMRWPNLILHLYKAIVMCTRHCHFHSNDTQQSKQ